METDVFCNLLVNFPHPQMEPTPPFRLYFTMDELRAACQAKELEKYKNDRPFTEVFLNLCGRRFSRHL